MKIKFKDILYGAILLLFAFVLIIKTSRNAFIDLTTNYPYLMGFVKVSILATMGELLASRIAKGDYKVKGIVYKFIIWGLIGCSFTLVFRIFPSGIQVVQKEHLLPQLHPADAFLNRLLTAFMTSTLMNLIFAPTFMAFHRFTDTYIELGEGKLKAMKNFSSHDVIQKIDWDSFIHFVVFKTIPFFWIPAHTITFLLPDVYRVLMAACLSIALGVILSFAKRKKTD